MAKKVQALVRLQIAPGKANPSPPIGPALGQQGVNIMEFCKAFNAKSQGMDPDLKVTVVITVYSDRSFTFIIKTASASGLILKKAKVSKGSSTPHTNKVAKLSRADIEEIAKIKLPDLTASDLEAAVRTVAGTARSMGIDVTGVN